MAKKKEEDLFIDGYENAQTYIMEETIKTMAQCSQDDYTYVKSFLNIFVDKFNEILKDIIEEPEDYNPKDENAGWLRGFQDMQEAAGMFDSAYLIDHFDTDAYKPDELDDFFVDLAVYQHQFYQTVSEISAKAQNKMPNNKHTARILVLDKSKQKHPKF